MRVEEHLNILCVWEEHLKILFTNKKNIWWFFSVWKKIYAWEKNIWTFAKCKNICFMWEEHFPRVGRIFEYFMSVRRTVKNFVRVKKTFHKREQNIGTIGQVGRMFDNGPGDLGSIAGRVIPKSLEMVIDISLWSEYLSDVCRWEQSNVWMLTI